MSTQSTLLLQKIVSAVVKSGASRLHLEVGSKPILRIDGRLRELSDFDLVVSEFLSDVADIVLDEKKKKELEAQRSLILTHVFEGGMRFKIHILYQKGNLAMIFTYIPQNILSPDELGLTQEFVDLLGREKGLIVVGGYHESGRTYTAFSLLNYINNTDARYILTIENPVEHLLNPTKSIVEQREVGSDTNNVLSAIQFCEESDVDVVFLSAIKDYQILKSTLSLINSGRLAIIIVEAGDVANAVSNLVDLAPETEMNKIKHEIAENLLGVTVQQRVARRGGGEITVNEILLSNSASIALIKEGRYSQLTSIVQTSREEGMRSMDQRLLEYVKTGEIDASEAMKVAVNKTDFEAAIRKFGGV